MNFLTAIISAPLFFLVWLFELRLYWTSAPGVIQQGKEVVVLAYIVSTLQMVSCWFWLFGFALGKINGILSEANEEGEEGNCVGLVGAEVLLSIFQLLTSIYTIMQTFVMRSVYMSSTKWKVKKISRSRAENVFLVVFIVLGVAYLPLAWITAWNRRCPQGTPVYLSVQHYFYPTFLVVDGFASLLSLYYAEDVSRRLNSKAIRSVGSKARSSERLVLELTKYFSFQCKNTIAGVAVAVFIFIMQYTVKIKSLSLVACVFCSLMYTTYALRRVPMLMKYLRSDHSWLPGSWSALWNTRQSLPNVDCLSGATTVSVSGPKSIAGSFRKTSAVVTPASISAVSTFRKA